ncbi:hypothetical protein MMC34_008103 [Xylographa carneopallida]|nr:hypothetical protein [Xylographa carneopallida]
MLDQEDLDRLQEAEGDPNKFVVSAPSDRHKLGATTVVCLILNRTIGSGIFILPATVLKGTDSIGITLIIWAFAGIVSIAALFVWLELSLSIPRYELDGNEVSVPRSGGEKNYLEYIYGNPKSLTTCIYGVLFIILGNLSGNAIGFGTYIMEAAALPNHDAAVRGLAIAALTTACLLHAVSRKGGIYLNNAFAFMKVTILLLIIVAGLAKLGGASLGSNSAVPTNNFDVHTSFSQPRKDVPSYATSLVYALYPYTGFMQPFYVLSEVKRPQGVFAKATITTMMSVVILYILFSVVSKTAIMDTGLNIASEFFQIIFGSAVAARVMSGIIALSIYGNIIVMTFTASRVKQEIAKEGILPCSRFFSSDTTTLFAKIWAEMHPPKTQQDEDLEKSPTAALLLHWVFSVLLIAWTSGQTTAVAYQILINLYTYVIMLLVSFFVSTGLLYLRWRNPQAWKEMSANFHPWGGPIAAILVSIVSAFLLVVAFIPPADDSPFAFAAQNFEWYIIPTVGLGGLLLGCAYFIIFRYIVPRVKGKQLVVERVPIIVSDDHGGWVQKHEIVKFLWGVTDDEEK